MSKNSKSSRARSGGSLRPLGAFRLVQGAQSQPVMHNGPTKNDPALLIHQLQALRVSTPPDSHLLREREREFREKETKLNDRISALEKTIAELRYQLKMKSDILEGLTATLDKKVEYYEGKLKQSDMEHSVMKADLKSVRDDVAIKQERIDSIIEEYEKKLKVLQNEYDQKIIQMQESHDEQIKIREEKMTTLKLRMSETIGKNSAERQQQLEELKRDLIKSSQEARDLHKQLKHMQLKPQKCKNCITLAAQLDEKSLQVRLKEKTINDLQNIGKSMQLQLSQQHKTIVNREKRSEDEYKALCIRAGIKPVPRRAVSSHCADVSRLRVHRREWRTSSANYRPKEKILEDTILTKWEEREMRDSTFK